jgi:hypothetical protein
MDEKESRKAEAEARRAIGDRTIHGPHPIERYLAAFAYGGRGSGATEKAPPKQERDDAKDASQTE